MDVSSNAFVYISTAEEPQNRQDALVGAAQMVLEVERIGKDSKTGMATVSLFKSSPQNFCNIPSNVDFSFSMQHTDLKTLQAMEDRIKNSFTRLR